MSQPIVEYTTNNSGGSWWLTDQNWHDLAAAGWDVKWWKDQDHKYFAGERFLGALATTATRIGLSLEDAIKEFETITGQDHTDEGCSCCGEPHAFRLIGPEGELHARTEAKTTIGIVRYKQDEEDEEDEDDGVGAAGLGLSLLGLLDSGAGDTDLGSTDWSGDGGSFDGGGASGDF